MLNKTHIPSILQAFVAALLFGASAPLSKLLLGEVEPIPLAAFLYLGTGIGLLGFKLVQRQSRKGDRSEARLHRSDSIWLAGAIFAGGVAAPIVLLFSLRETPAATASLLLNFEGVATTLIAALAFKEAIGRRAWIAVILITVSSILLSINLNGGWGLSIGAFGILAACLFWGLDNNFTRNISGKDPVTIVTVKGLGAGSFSLIMALVLGSQFPDWKIILGAMILGSLAYGASIVLFIRAMRGLGAARASAVFSTAPLTGMILSLLLFRDLPNGLFFLALPLMVIGTLFLINEEHEHTHVHEAVEHDHAHTHDDGHHNHVHVGGINKRHSHPHSHSQVAHSHHHLPDIHHRHVHESGD